MKSLCCFCRLPRAELKCEVCHESVCKSCVERLHEDAFDLRTETPEVLKHQIYCPTCFATHVEPAQTEYAATLELAKNVHFWPRAYRGMVPILKKSRIEIAVESGTDRDAVLLKMGFKAAELGFNGMINGELNSRKVRNFGYQKTEWSGKALLATVDEEKLSRNEFREAHWRVLHHR